MSGSNVCLKIAAWPARDREIWLAAAKSVGLLDETTAASDWSPSTLRKTANGYGHWLRWLMDSGCLDANAPASSRVTRDGVAAYIQFLTEAGLKPYSQVNRIQELHDALRVLDPQSPLCWLSRVLAILRARARPQNDKAARLRSPADLITLGRSLMRTADETKDWSAQRRAVWFRDGLIIALLASRPLRMRNFTSIQIGKHLVETHGSYWLVFPASEMKARQPFELTFPDQLLGALHTYLDHYRPILLLGETGHVPSDQNALWVSEMGTAMEQGNLGVRIRKHTARAFGGSVTPHWFRDAAATEIAMSNPTHMDDAHRVLGHSSPTTTERYYNQARSFDAAQRFQNVLDRAT